MALLRYTQQDAMMPHPLPHREPLMTTPDASDRVTALRRNLGPTGIWSGVPESLWCGRPRPGRRGRKARLRLALAGRQPHGPGRLHPAGDAAGRVDQADHRHRHRQHLGPGAVRHAPGCRHAVHRLPGPVHPRPGRQPRPRGRKARPVLRPPYSAMERYLDEMDHPSGRRPARRPAEPRSPANGRSASWPRSARGCWSCPGTRPTGPTRTSARSSTPRSRARSSARTSC